MPFLALQDQAIFKLFCQSFFPRIFELIWEGGLLQTMAGYKGWGMILNYEAMGFVWAVTADAADNHGNE